MWRFTASAIAAFSLALIIGTSGGQAEENCPADAAWLPNTSAPDNKQPEDPLADCSAYRWAWQTFLYATQADGNRSPAFLSYKRMTDVFSGTQSLNFAASASKAMLSLAPRTAKSPGPVIDQGVQQALSHGVLIDQDGHAVYYAIHMNDVFVDFVTTKRGYNDPQKLKKADPADVFPMGSLELKSSWRIVDSDAPPAGYITTTAAVPTLQMVDGEVEADPSNPRPVTVALLGLHVVGVIENHPEFIWASFEHDAIAPAATQNPEKTDPNQVISNVSFPLYASATKSKDANKTPSGITLNEATQTLSPPTSVYRAFPGSSSDEAEVDEAVSSLNRNVDDLFRSKDTRNVDPRRNYHLVGAVWLKSGARDFDLNASFGGAKLAGENAMSNMSMESFTQTKQQNCFACHDTTPTAGLPALRLNVSHILPLFFGEQNGG